MSRQMDHPELPGSRREAARRRRRVVRNIRKLYAWGAIDWHELHRMLDELARRSA